MLGLVSKLLGKAWKGLSKEDQRKWKTGEGEVPDVEIDPSWLEDTQDQEEGVTTDEAEKDGAVCALAIYQAYQSSVQLLACGRPLPICLAFCGLSASRFVGHLPPPLDASLSRQATALAMLSQEATAPAMPSAMGVRASLDSA